MSTPIVANTLVSSVSEVHAFVGPVAADRYVDLVRRHDLAAVDPAVPVDVVDLDLVRLLLIASGEVDEGRDRRVVDDDDAELDRGRRHPLPERRRLRQRSAGRGRRAALRRAAARTRCEEHGGRDPDRQRGVEPAPEPGVSAAW